MDNCRTRKRSDSPYCPASHWVFQCLSDITYMPGWLFPAMTYLMEQGGGPMN